MEHLRPLIVIIGLMLMSIGVHAAPGHNDGLPPGLQKKVERGEGLPPGWAKKLGRGDYFPQRYYHYGEVSRVDDRYDRIRLEDRIYRVIRDTREIVEILQN